MFVDEVYIKVKSGNGGDGASTFRREKYVQFGGPDGGDGGRGGDIIFEVDSSINTLIDFKYKKKFFAPDGEPGERSRSNGKSADNLIIKVPVGTLVREKESNKLLMDLREDGEKRTFIEGGRGGLGNYHFKSSIRRAPKIALRGKKGFEIELKLELKLLADIALVGFPNVGKSSLINKISAAKSKVANYHFTTLSPKLGVVKIDEGDSFVIADIPGLIEGAHEGVGLGDKFLKHIERCKMIFHLIDISGIEGRDPIKDFELINNELKKYSEKLYNKKQYVLANKIDLLGDDSNIRDLENYLREREISLFPISVITGERLDEVIKKAYTELSEIEREPMEEELSLEEVVDVEALEKDWIITKGKDDIYYVEGKVITQTFDKYVFKNEESIVDFLRILRKRGLENKLRNFGVKDGDVVNISGIEFDFVE